MNDSIVLVGAGYLFFLADVGWISTGKNIKQ